MRDSLLYINHTIEQYKTRLHKGKAQCQKQTCTRASTSSSLILRTSSQLFRASFPLPSWTNTLHRPRWRCTLCARWLGSTASAVLNSSTATRNLPLLTLSSACQKQTKNRNGSSAPQTDGTKEESKYKWKYAFTLQQQLLCILTLLLFFSRFFNPKYAFFSSLCSGSRRRPFW